MSQSDSTGDRPEGATRAWGDGDSEETQIVRPQPGALGQGASTGSSPSSSGAAAQSPSPEADRLYSGTSEATQQVDAYAPPAAGPAGAPATGPVPATNAPDPAGWAPYSEQPSYADQPAMTSVYPQSPPGYAPTGYPPAYAPAVIVAAAPVPATPEQTSNRVGPAFICALAGVILTAGGMLLAGKYGIAAATDLTGTRGVVIKDSGLATVGAVLILGAFVLNGWSPWATVIPGIVLTGIGGWSLYDTGATVTVGRWTNSVLTTNQLSIWHISGVTLTVGLAMLAASAAAALARAGGKRDGQILGRRQL